MSSIPPAPSTNDNIDPFASDSELGLSPRPNVMDLDTPLAQQKSAFDHSNEPSDDRSDAIPRPITPPILRTPRVVRRAAQKRRRVDTRISQVIDFTEESTSSTTSRAFKASKRPALRWKEEEVAYFIQQLAKFSSTGAWVKDTTDRARSKAFELVKAEMDLRWPGKFDLKHIRHRFDYEKQRYKVWSSIAATSGHSFDSTTGRFDFSPERWEQLILQHTTTNMPATWIKTTPWLQRDLYEEIFQSITGNGQRLVTINDRISQLADSQRLDATLSLEREYKRVTAAESTAELAKVIREILLGIIVINGILYRVLCNAIANKRLAL